MTEESGSPRRGAAFDRDWTKGSIVGNLLTLAWPMMISSGLNLMGPTIDMIWVGKLGTASIAGVGVAGSIIMMVNSARMGLSVGTRAIIARFVGAGDFEAANHVARQAIVVSAIFAAFVAGIGISFAEPILGLFGLSPEVIAEGAAYMRIMLVGSVFMSFRTVAEGIMHSSGDAMTPMRISLFYRLFHVALAPFLIFGWWIFPRLGVSGAGLSNAIAETLGMALGLWILFSGRTRLRVTLRNFRFDPNIIWRITKIGIPASIMGMERPFGNLMLLWVIAPFGTLAVAAHSLLQRITMTLFMPAVGMGAATGILVAQNLGAGQPGRAEKHGWVSVGMEEIFMMTVGVLVLIWAENIVGIFNTDPGLVVIASTFLRISVTSFIVVGVAACLQHSISSVGDTLPPMLVTVLTQWLVVLPLALFLSRSTDLGMNGVRWAIVTGTYVRAITFATYFRMGRWKRKKV